MKKLTSSNLPCPVCKPHRHGPRPPVIADPLDSPFVSDAVQPIPGADIGLNIRLVQPWLTVRFSKWFNFNKGDTFKLFMGSFTYAIAIDDIRQEDLDPDKNFVTLMIPEGLVPRGYIYPCFGQVERVGSGTPSISPYQTWLVKTDRPGGVSTNPYYHSRLIMHLPPDLVDGVLDPERAKQGVDLTVDPYPNMAVGDTIEVWWNGHPVFLEIDQDHLDGIKPIVVHVPESTIIAGGSGWVVIYFRVFDIVFNYSGEVPQWSMPIRVETDLNKLLLNRAHFTVNEDSVDELDYDKDGEKPLKVEVVIPKTLPNGVSTPAGAMIHVKLTLIDSDGGRTTVLLTPFAARIDRSATTPVDKKYAEAVIGGHLEIEYELKTSTGSLLGTSRRLNVTVSGVKRSMPAMTIDKNEGGFIDPSISYFQAFFPEFSPYDADWSVTFRMEALDSTNRLVEYEEELLAGAKEPPPPPRTVLQEQFSRFIGLGLVSVFYLVNDGRMRIMGSGIQTVRKSEVLEVTFGAAVRSMPAPKLQHVDLLNNLDIDSIIGTTLNLTLTETRTAPGDIFEWFLRGSASNGSTSDDIKLNSSTAGRQVVVPVDAKYAIANNDGEIRLSYTLQPADNSPKRFSDVLLITVGKALTLIRPEVAEATRYPDQLAAVAATGGATVVANIAQLRPTDQVETCWSGIPGIGTYCETQNGNTSKVVYTAIDPDVVGANIQEKGHFIQVQYFLIRGLHKTPSQVLNLELLPPPFPKAYLEGHALDAVLDLSTLKGTERALVDPWFFIHHFQRVWFELLGTYADDTQFYHAFSYGDLVGLDGEQNGLHPLAPIAEIRKLKDGTQLSMRCAVTFDRSSDLSNAVRFLQRDYTVRALPAQYPVPILEKASGSGTLVTLAALDAQYGANLRVSYGPMSTTDRIYVEVLGSAGAGSATIGPIYGETDGTVNVPLDAALIAANIGSTRTQFTIRYTVTKGTDTRPSVLLTVNLDPLPQAELKKTVLQIDEATPTGIIDLDTVGNATARAGIWPFIAKHQPVWLKLFGTDRAGKALNLTLLDGTTNGEVDAAWISQGYHLETVLSSYLHNLGNGSLLTLQLKVALNGVRDEWRAIEFPSKHYTVRSVMVHDCTTFTSDNMNYWVSEYADAGIRRDPDGNFFWHAFPKTGSGVGLQKIFAPNAAGYYRVKLRYRISKFAAIGAPTFVEVHLGTLKKRFDVTAINTWLSADVVMGYLNGPFEASVSVGNPTTGGLYDLDDICIVQTPYPI
ncbi:hypothetical protein [Pseudomonas azotoformans]|uniref:Uncharacterized protein n=1 Tax=Pseudomonas azotoformans TaxID=47878 RepID=A0A127I1S7_PSEAZ|nr:hypothetical protein [Pseudomonas azotoformans]AMN80643.1 hypothetical protein AYR47_21070 [Pseudomonas azotoformans]